jgi:hypothetical protein
MQVQGVRQAPVRRQPAAARWRYRRRADEGHAAVTRRAVDRYAAGDEGVAGGLRPGRARRSRGQQDRRQERDANGPARSAVRASGGPQRAPGLTFPFGRARLLGIRLVVFSGVFEPRDLVGEGILKTY